MPLAYAVVASMFLVVFSGCLAPVEPAELEISIKLDDDQVQMIQDVAGTVEIKNPGPTTVEATTLCGRKFMVQRISDSEIFLDPTVTHCDYEGNPVTKSRFGPGETVREPFSLRWWEEIGDEFDLGTYGITVRLFRENWTSEQVLFSIG